MLTAMPRAATEAACVVAVAALLRGRSEFVIKWVAVATSMKQDCLEGCCESLCGRMGGLPVFRR